jgi:ATP-dependent helicase HrpA
MIGALAVTLVSMDQLQADALECIRRWVCDARRMGRQEVGAVAPNGPSGGGARAVDPPSPSFGATGGNRPYRLTATAFTAAVAQAKQDLRGLVPKLGDWLKEAFNLRLELETHAQPYPGLAQDLATLLPPDFLRTMPFDRVKHLPRYLRGMKARADRWKRDAGKDAQRAAELAPFVAAVRRRTVGAGLPREESGRSAVAKAMADRRAPPTAEAGENLRWLVEEFRVSLFAQELGTAEPVSAVRLQRLLEEQGAGRAEPKGPSAGGGKATEAPRPAVAPAVTKKSAPLKSLGALDQLFRK